MVTASGRLAGKVAAITGAASGIGLATAELFLREGAQVAIVDKVRAGIGLALVGDVSDEASIQEALKKIISSFGGLDILVNNAAARAHGSLAGASEESWDEVLRVNVVAAATCAKATLPWLRQRKGAIVNVASAFALFGRRGFGQYDASKAALVSLTRTLAAEEAVAGVRVNAVCPGSVLTPYTLGRAGARGMTEEELRAKGAVPSLLARWATPEEIAWPILWLASDEASFITGAVLPVDGGVSASIT